MVPVVVGGVDHEVVVAIVVAITRDGRAFGTGVNLDGFVSRIVDVKGSTFVIVIFVVVVGKKHLFEHLSSLLIVLEDVQVRVNPRYIG